jgi:hypothetical protein
VAIQSSKNGKKEKEKRKKTENLLGHIYGMIIERGQTANIVHQIIVFIRKRRLAKSEKKKKGQKKKNKKKKQKK